MNPNEPKFLGRGWAFPPSFDKRPWEVTMVSGAEDISQSLHLLLATELGERVMQPGYGSNLKRMIFEPMGLTDQTIMTEQIKHIILLHEPRIILDQVTYEQSDVNQGIIMIQLDYTIRTTNNRFNFVYPFYLNEGTEVSSIQSSLPGPSDF